jgi:hypothetical protein
MQKVKGDRDGNYCLTTPAFLPRYQEVRKLPLVLVGAPLKETFTRAKLLVG